MSDRMRRLDLADRLDVEPALEVAFAPIRARRATAGPTRVRAAVRWGRASTPAPLPWAAAVARVSELGMAVGMSAFVFAASLTSVPIADGPAPEPVGEVEVVVVAEAFPVPRVTKPLEDDRYIRWLKLGRDVTSDDRIDASIPLAARDAEPELDPRLQLLLRALIPVR